MGVYCAVKTQVLCEGVEGCHGGFLTQWRHLVVKL